jgi:hypothetical protein
MKPIFTLFLAVASVIPVMADPRLTSWHTEESGKYARLYQSTSDMNAGNASTTWSRGAGVQSQPTYAGVSQILYSTNWVYIRTSGLAGYIMGPWYLDAAKANLFPNFPSNRARIYRIPRIPSIPASTSLTGLGQAGSMVNGVSMYDMRDAFSYVNASSTDATPINGLTGDGVWNRDAYHNEAVTFDPAYAHQAGNDYHYHAQPVALRHQLNDHVDYDPVTKLYTESTAPVTSHSPIVGWAADGIPVYGPYGYSDALDPNSGIRRMISGFVLRNGSNGTTNLSATGRTTLPAWAQRIQTVTFKNGPAVNATYALGHYIEDYDYLGDRGYTQGTHFDLNEQNARWCVTPEFPSGTWAYFTTIAADGTPLFPYTIGRQYFGSPTGGASSISETVTTFFNGGPNKTEAAEAPSIDETSGDVTLTWSAVEGGTYLVQSSESLSGWSTLVSATNAASDYAAIVDPGAKNNHDQRFYRVSRTSLASFDTNGFDYMPPGGGSSNSVAPGGSAARGTTVTVTITLPTSPPNPPVNVIPTSITLAGTIQGASLSRPSATTAQATFVIPANAPTGAQNIVVVFNPGPTYTLTGGFTIN